MTLAHDFIDELRRVAPHLAQSLRWCPAEDTLSLPRLELLGTRLDAARAAVTSRARVVLNDHLTHVSDSPLLSRVSLFRSIGMCRQETAHTQALAWLVDPTQPHEFDRALLQAFLRAALPKGERADATDALLGPRAAVKRVVPEFHLSPSCRVDLLAEGLGVDGCPWLLVVEAKVGAQERARQLAAYDTALRAHLRPRPEDVRVVRVFLSEKGSTGKSAGPGAAWFSLSFRDLAREFLQVYPGLRERAGHPFLGQSAFYLHASHTA